MGMGVVGGGLGAVIITIIALMMGIDPAAIVPTDSPAGGVAPAPAEDDTMAMFVSVVLADTEDVWRQILAEAGQPYVEPNLILYSGAVQSACGFAQAAVGPFYCPADEDVYIDLSFFRELATRLGAEGDFAQAYVIAHEVGHHIQTLTGVSQQVQAARARQGATQANAASVRLELQADCYAGVWANRAEQQFGILEPGDVAEALGAASAVGDDRLQSASQGQVVPESFTHGTSEQRMRWFQTGFQAGNPNACDTFSGSI